MSYVQSQKDEDNQDTIFAQALLLYSAIMGGSRAFFRLRSRSAPKNKNISLVESLMRSLESLNCYYLSDLSEKELLMLETIYAQVKAGKIMGSLSGDMCSPQREAIRSRLIAIKQKQKIINDLMAISAMAKSLSLKLDTYRLLFPGFIEERACIVDVGKKARVLLASLNETNT